jgi:hypothetical protein
MTEERPISPADDEISPYLQQPLRTLDQAKQDRTHQQRQTGEPETKLGQPK